jgi:hypothetical protein
VNKYTKEIKNDILISKENFDKLIIERDDLKRQLAELKRMLFGVKSKQFTSVDSTQLAVFEQMVQEQEKQLKAYTVV